MVRKLVFVMATFVVAICATTVMAGDFHRKTNLICSDCHTMHSSVSHSYAGGAPDGTVTSTTGYGKLLKAASADELCLTCHDGQAFAPDVKGDHGNGYVREAGGITTGAAPYEDWKGHTLGYNGTIPGGGQLVNVYTGAPEALGCTSCHGAHGASLPSGNSGLPQAVQDRGQWRNLRGNVNKMTPQITLAYATGTNDPTLPIFEHDATLGQISTHYSVDNVDFNNPDATNHASAIGSFCKGCHTNFHGSAADANMNNGTDWVRHPTATVALSASELTRRNSMTNKVKVMSDGTSYTPSCFTCHKSHGNKNAFGLIYMKGTGTVTEQGDNGTQLPDLCHQCHGMGA